MPGHQGHSRSLHENPDGTVDHRPDICPECHGHLEADLEGDVIGEYDEIEVPLIKPFVRRPKSRKSGGCAYVVRTVHQR